MARRSSRPEEEKDAGKPVDPTEWMPEPHTSEQFDEKRIESIPEQDLANWGGSEPFFRYISPEGSLDQDMSPAWEVKTFPSAVEPIPSSYESSLTPAPFTDPSEPMPDELTELDDAEDWEEPEGRLDEADVYDEEEDDDEED